MNATTATQNHGPKETPLTATADGATSTTPQRIDSVIKQLFDRASSGDFSALKSSAIQARQHGFTSCANLRLSGFLEEFRATPLREHYATEYPQCVFLTHAGLRGLMKALNLWCDLPQHYVGAIPPEQLPWLDVFSLDTGDAVPMQEIGELCDLSDFALGLVDYCSTDERGRSGFGRSMRYTRGVEYFRASKPADYANINAALKQFAESWFVVAPPEAFNSTEDFFTRFQKMSKEAVQRMTTPPDDPLVIRFVRGGCLVVAAWGEEAAIINAAAREVGV